MKRILLSLTVNVLLIYHASASVSMDLNLQTDSSTEIHEYTYWSDIFLSEERRYTLDGTVNSKTKYTNVIYYGSGTPMLDSLLVNKFYHLPIEVIQFDHDKVVGGKLYSYYPSKKGLRKEELFLLVPSRGFAIPFKYSGVDGPINPPLPGRGINHDDRYKLSVTYDVYDSKNNLLQNTAADGITSSVVWGYNDRYPIAEISNAKISDVAYSSFEKRAKGNWQFNGSSSVDITSPMGEQCYNLAGGTITKTGLTTNKHYRLSYWQKQGANVTISGGTVISTVNGRSLDGWTFVVKILNVTGPVSISGTGFLDELRLHPKEAFMTSTAYKPLFGVICKADASGRTVYYEYDGFQRIKYERDQNKNIIQSYTYHIKL